MADIEALLSKLGDATDIASDLNELNDRLESENAKLQVTLAIEIETRKHVETLNQKLYEERVLLLAPT